MADNQRRTSSGVVQGFRAGAAWAFLGIPYAAPPLGEQMRFRPPVPPSHWEGVREAEAFGAACVQLLETGAVVGSEDCLTLNVWTPTEQADALRPVMVWIHGGDNVGGAAADPGFLGGQIYDGQQLAVRGDLVLVSIQYRLGAFGFLSHPDLATDNDRGATGNWGLMDQLLALEWVRSNIEVFGGDPDRVTVFGQSAGADDTCALVASPRAAGLFRGAIMMSPGGCHYNDAPVSARITAEVVDALGCAAASDQIACLRRADVEALARAPQSGAPLHPDRVDFYVEIDGWVLTRPPRQSLRAGLHNAVPLIFGTTAEEYLLIFSQTLPETISQQDYPGWLAALFGDDLAEDVAAVYDPQRYGSTFMALVAAQGDAVHHCAVRAAARAAAASQAAPVYRYVYGHRYEDEHLAPYAASHGFDIPLAFANTEGMALSAAEVALSDRLLGAFARFAHTGSPSSPGDDDWPVYEASTDLYTVVDVDWRDISGFREDACDFWDAVEKGVRP